MYTVVGTAYMVIVAFVFFIAFESYGGAKADAEEGDRHARDVPRRALRPGGPRGAAGADDLLRARGHLGRVAAMRKAEGAP